MPRKPRRTMAEELGIKKKEPVLTPREIAEAEQRLGIVFRDKLHLDRAFVHRSYLNECGRSGVEHNERIEFLGDCVLEFVVGEYLYRQYPDHSEGDLTAYRSALVNNRMLAGVVDELQLAPFIRLSRGERKFFDLNERSAQRIKGCLFEAVVGAIYLDRGVGTVELFIGEVLLPKLRPTIEQGLHLDAKSQFQLLAQDELGVTPEYRILDESGPDHDKTFLAGAFIGDRMVGQGTGPSKQEAEKVAAQDALKSASQVASQ